jgi:oxygen-dependent protoporphyrinogen oxidase
MSTETRVGTIVVGAGISGLAYAAFHGFDSDLVVLEAAPRAGGLLHTVVKDGVRFEDGPETIQGGAEPVRELFNLAGVAAQSPAASKRFLVHRGKLEELPSGPKGLLSTPILSGLGKARFLMEPTRSGATALEGSIAEFVQHRFGKEVLETLADAFVNGIFAGDPAQLSMRACFPEVVGMVERHGSLMAALKARKKSGHSSPSGGISKPAGGMGRLTDALAAKLGNKLRLSCAARGVAQSKGGWRVITDREEFVCSRLVLATSARELARLAREGLPEISRAMEALPLEAEPLAGLVTVWTRAQVRHALDGFGYLAPAREGLRHLGTLFSSSIDPDCAPSGTVVLRTLFGGARQPQMATAGEAELLAVVRDEVGPLLGLSGTPKSLWHSRWGPVLPRYDLRHPERVAQLERAAASYPGLGILGNYLRGVGVPALIGQARSLDRTSAS